MTQCAVDGSWCCGGPMTSIECCARNNRISLAAIVGISSQISSPIPSTASTITSILGPASTTISISGTFSTSVTRSTGASETSSPLVNPPGSSLSSASNHPDSATSIPNPSKSENRAENIGFGVGIAGVLVAILAIGTMSFKLKRLQRQATMSPVQGQNSIQEGKESIQ